MTNRLRQSKKANRRYFIWQLKLEVARCEAAAKSYNCKACKFSVESSPASCFCFSHPELCELYITVALFLSTLQ
jgi:hypothetical protein